MNDILGTGDDGEEPLRLERPNVSAIYVNTEQEVIVVTKDKIRLCLQANIERMGKRDRWLVPLGVLVPLVLTVTTTSFTERFKVGGGEWETIYIMLIIATVIWLGYAFLTRGGKVSVDSVVEELARNPANIGSPKQVDLAPIEQEGKAAPSTGASTP